MEKLRINPKNTEYSLNKYFSFFQDLCWLVFVSLAEERNTTRNQYMCYLFINIIVQFRNKIYQYINLRAQKWCLSTLHQIGK